MRVQASCSRGTEVQSSSCQNGKDQATTAACEALAHLDTSQQQQQSGPQSGHSNMGAAAAYTYDENPKSTSHSANAATYSRIQSGSACRSDQITPQKAAPLFRAPSKVDVVGALDFDDLLDELNSISVAAKGNPEASSRTQAENRGGADAADLNGAMEVCLNDSHTVQLPNQLSEFWINAMLEPEAESLSAAAMADEHVQKLLEQYQHSEAAEKGAERPLDVQGDFRGEAYEGSTAYDKYCKRLARQPNQCVRFVAWNLLASPMSSSENSVTQLLCLHSCCTTWQTGQYITTCTAGPC
jgi:hypothetical protein